MREAYSIGVKSLCKEPVVGTSRRRLGWLKSKKMVALQEGEKLGRIVSMQGLTCHAKEPKDLAIYLRGTRKYWRIVSKSWIYHIEYQIIPSGWGADNVWNGAEAVAGKYVMCFYINPDKKGSWLGLRLVTKQMTIGFMLRSETPGGQRKWKIRSILKFFFSEFSSGKGHSFLYLLKECFTCYYMYILFYILYIIVLISIIIINLYWYSLHILYINRHFKKLSEIYFRIFCSIL